MRLKLFALSSVLLCASAEASLITPAVTLISAVQGNPSTYTSNRFGDTDVSPLLGQIVTVEGVVVGDFQNGDDDSARNLSGFFLQEESTDEDGDPLSSEAVFVFQSGSAQAVALGDRVRVTGTVEQYFGETQIGKVSEVVVLERDQLASVSIAGISLAGNLEVSRSQNGSYQPDLEAYEGMLVRIDDTLSISEQYQLDRFNEIRLIAGERAYQYTQLNRPSEAGFTAHQRSLGARTIIYDDGLNQQNAAVSLLDGFAGYQESTAPRMGDTVQNLTGVLDYKWAGNSASGATWRVRAHTDDLNRFTATASGDSPNPRPLQAPQVAGNLQVASFNVLNFFTTLDSSGAVTAVGMEPRGANNATEFERQLAKLTHALLELNADVVGLVELENEFDDVNDGSTAIETLVNALNKALGGQVYDYIFPGTQFLGSDAIAVGVIYKPAVVRPVGSPAWLNDQAAAQLPAFSGRDFSADPIFDGEASNRVPLAVTFKHRESHDKFSLVVNHFKSKGASGLADTESPNYDRNDGAGFWNQRRLDAAVAVTQWLATDPTGAGDGDVILLGDLNAYAAEAPVSYLLNNGFLNAESAEAYSYVFDGQVGTLDYLLVSESMAEKLEQAAVWHINADEADALDYNLDFGRDPSYFNAATATRNSDHDPVIAGFELVYQRTTVKDLLLAFLAAYDRGDLEVLAPTAKAAQEKLRVLIKQLEWAEQWSGNGQERLVCHFLERVDQASAGGLPLEWLKGPGLPEFQALLHKTMHDVGCE